MSAIREVDLKSKSIEEVVKEIIKKLSGRKF
jgi:hypothetical protein